LKYQTGTAYRKPGSQPSGRAPRQLQRLSNVTTQQSTMFKVTLSHR